MQKIPLAASLWLALTACTRPNPHYHADLGPSAEQAPCTIYPPGGGGGQGRPQVLVRGGAYHLDGQVYTVADFYLDVFLVTVGGYRDCVTAGACGKPGSGGACSWTESPGAREEMPINCLTWAQANTFCSVYAGMGRRLPGEGEWQYAAAGPDMSTYPWGEEAPQTGAAAQLCWDQASDMGTGPCEVDKFQRTLFGVQGCHGISDLAGNVKEWTNSEYRRPYQYPEPTCSMNSSLCSIRGGSWQQNDQEWFQTTFRDFVTPSLAFDDVGFRCARSAQ